LIRLAFVAAIVPFFRQWFSLAAIITQLFPEVQGIYICALRASGVDVR
jgi:hypothetical protein